MLLVNIALFQNFVFSAYFTLCLYSKFKERELTTSDLLLYGVKESLWFPTLFWFCMAPRWISRMLVYYDAWFSLRSNSRLIWLKPIQGHGLSAGVMKKNLIILDIFLSSILIVTGGSENVHIVTKLTLLLEIEKCNFQLIRGRIQIYFNRKLQLWWSSPFFSRSCVCQMCTTIILNLFRTKKIFHYKFSNVPNLDTDYVKTFVFNLQFLVFLRLRQLGTSKSFSDFICGWRSWEESFQVFQAPKNSLEWNWWKEWIALEMIFGWKTVLMTIVITVEFLRTRAKKGCVRRSSWEFISKLRNEWGWREMM